MTNPVGIQSNCELSDSPSPRWQEFIEFGRRQLSSLAGILLLIVAALVLLVLQTHSDLQLPVMVFLSAAAGLSSMSAP